MLDNENFAGILQHVLKCIHGLCLKIELPFSLNADLLDYS